MSLKSAIAQPYARAVTKAVMEQATSYEEPGPHEIAGRVDCRADDVCTIDPWNAQTTASYGLRTDTTYYYQVKTVDAGLTTSDWSAVGTLNTTVSPSSSTLSAARGTIPPIWPASRTWA